MQFSVKTNEKYVDFYMYNWYAKSKHFMEVQWCIEK